MQNEPLNITSNYPSMGMSATEEEIFIKTYLGPALASAKITSKLMVYDHNWDNTSYAETIFADPQAAAYVAGVAWHCYAGSVSAELTVHNAYPNMDTWETECSGGTWAPNWASNLKWIVENVVIQNARDWGKAGVRWAIALDPIGGPTTNVNGCTSCTGVVTVNENTGTYSKNVEYYAFGQASKFVDSGAYRIASNGWGSTNVDDVAFQNPDGTYVVVVLNNNSAARTITILWNGQTISFKMPSGAVATFKWAGTSATPTFVPPTPTP